MTHTFTPPEATSEPDTWDDSEGLSIAEALARYEIIEELVALGHYLLRILGHFGFCDPEDHTSHTFHFAHKGSTWRPIDVERLLRRHGIRIWGRGYDGKEVYFRTKRKQARWAEYLMASQGVPLTSEWINPSLAMFLDNPSRPEPEAKGPPLKPGILERIFTLFLD